MIDWFIILTPLVLIPIALLFIFIGCTSTEPTFVLGPSPILKLTIDKGSFTNVHKITVTFSVVPTDQTFGPTEITDAEIAPGFVVEHDTDFPPDEVFTCTCTCTITITEPAEGETPPWVVIANLEREAEVANLWYDSPHFLLSGEEDDFDLTGWPVSNRDIG